MSDWNERAAKCLKFEAQYRDIQAVDKRLSYYEKHEKGNRLIGLVSEWNPCADPLQAAMLETEIKQKKLIDEYIEALSEVFTREYRFWSYDQVSELWTYATATPAQRTEAAVLTLEGGLLRT